MHHVYNWAVCLVAVHLELIGSHGLYVFTYYRLAWPCVIMIQTKRQLIMQTMSIMIGRKQS